MKLSKFTGVMLGAALSAVAVAAQAGTPPALYTTAQANAGAPVYTQNCAMCHGADLKGVAGPALIGPSFPAAGSAATIGSVFTVLAQQMPAGQPGSLSHDQYADLMAYILSKNGYPAGSTALDYTASLSSKTPLVSQVK
ncbi:c-type cytochrome [Acidocella sp. KAb 2-4]|uniref:c-type cytochrome n=1 Tax=Acidocella sp. KAb 2-4 TaxID=2885158 RepID=UPI001D08F02F|nr:cytochrome c [Acidocella sp. KAb 2-4]MCB5944411.1 cytochrome c [Acidocella sp. KAb 2-4]